MRAASPAPTYPTIPHMLCSSTLTVHDASKLPDTEVSCAKPPFGELRLQPRENLLIRKALGLQRVVPAADELFRCLIHRSQHLAEHARRLGARQAAGSNEVVKNFIKPGPVRHTSLCLRMRI